MGEFDERFARLKIILLLFIFLLSMVTCEIVFFGSSPNEDIIDTSDNIETINKPSGIWDGLVSIGGAIVTFFTYVFNLITFTLPSIPLWMTVIMAPIMTITLIVEVYITIDFVYSFVKALPFT